MKGSGNSERGLRPHTTDDTRKPKKKPRDSRDVKVNEVNKVHQEGRLL